MTEEALAPATPETPAPATPPTGGDAPPSAPTPEQPAALTPDFDWRKEFAGDDEKALKRLEKYQSPKDFAKSAFEAESKVGELSRKITPELPKNATPEQVKEWRAKVGIPDTPDGYQIGIDIPENDKPLVNMFLSKALERNTTPDVAKAALSIYYAMEQELTLQAAEQMKETASQHEEVLRSEWGADFKSNMTINTNFIKAAIPAEDYEALKGGVAADGTPLETHPAFRKLINSYARTAGMIDGRAYDDSNELTSIENSISEIENILRTDNARYYREGLDKKLNKLYETQNKYGQNKK